MPFLVRGGITLDGVQFNTDPETYEPVNWEKRYNVVMAIGGALTIQDFGTFKKDNTLRLQSGGSRPLEESVVASLHARFRARGVSYNYTDWLNNSFNVFIEKFVPIPLKKGIQQVALSGTSPISIYTYTLDLHVLNITQLFGAPFTGP